MVHALTRNEKKKRNWTLCIPKAKTNSGKYFRNTFHVRYMLRSLKHLYEAIVQMNSHGLNTFQFIKAKNLNILDGHRFDPFTTIDAR